MNFWVTFLLIAPFGGAVLAYLLGRGKKELAFWTAEIVGGLLLLATLVLLVGYTHPIDIPMEWYRFGGFSIPFGVYIDKLSLVMLLIATGLGWLDIHFAHDYMGGIPTSRATTPRCSFLSAG